MQILTLQVEKCGATVDLRMDRLPQDTHKGRTGEQEEKKSFYLITKIINGPYR